MKYQPALVSVVIPAFNRSKSLRNTVLSVHSNDYRPIEVVIVDDGSTDSTHEIGTGLVSEFNSQDFKVVLLTQENKGAPAARNNGSKLSEGEYILFLDSDDEIPENKIKVHVELMIRTKSDATVSDFHIIYDDELGGEVKYISNANPVKKVAFNKSVGCSSTVLHRDLAEAIVWTESLPKFQDMDYFLKALVLSRKVVHIDRPLYTYYRNSSGTISTTTVEVPIPYRKRVLSLIEGANLNFSYPSSIRNRMWGVFSLFYLIWRWFLSTIRKSLRLLSRKVKNIH